MEQKVDLEPGEYNIYLKYILVNTKLVYFKVEENKEYILSWEQTWKWPIILATSVTLFILIILEILGMDYTVGVRILVLTIAPIFFLLTWNDFLLLQVFYFLKENVKK